MSTQYPALVQFFSGYFHQDWRSDHATEDEVIRAFVADSSIEMIARVKDELILVVNTIQNEGELQEFLFEGLGCSYYYPYAWPSGRAWLEHVLGML
ncbi:contact-dependent growth inhibition system immunity protein [Pseudomonas sp. NFX15]|uniref:contact-dependent growth inhibition system immunity protein n=1 Tax=Pseudomonas sp. NFX15 TaxID=2816958 RepID=UPI003B8C0033